VAEPTGFEPATSDVTGRRSNQLNYDSAGNSSFQKSDKLNFVALSVQGTTGSLWYAVGQGDW
jgi:hypothetical protein